MFNPGLCRHFVPLHLPRRLRCGFVDSTTGILIQGVPQSEFYFSSELRTNFGSSLDMVEFSNDRCLRCLLLVMCTHPFAKEALTLYLARSEGHERYFGCNLMHRRILA